MRRAPLDISNRSVVQLDGSPILVDELRKILRQGAEYANGSDVDLCGFFRADGPKQAQPITRPATDGETLLTLAWLGLALLGAWP